MEIAIGEALRYLGAGEDAPEDLRRDVAETARDLSRRITPRFVWRSFPLHREAEGFRLKETAIFLTGKTAGTMLRECGAAAVFLCTLGAQFDALLRSVQARDMARAVILDACGSALTEAGCDAAEAAIRSRFPERFLTDRFSPGYGDLPLSLQGAICDTLDGGRRLGVRVTDSLLLNPGKSVTALVGIAETPQAARIRGCAYCNLRETCTIRKGGNHCGSA